MTKSIVDFVEDHFMGLVFIGFFAIIIGFIAWDLTASDSPAQQKKIEQQKFESIKNDCKALALFIRDNYNGYYEKEYEHYYSWSCQK